MYSGTITEGNLVIEIEPTKKANCSHLYDVIINGKKEYEAIQQSQVDYLVDGLLLGYRIVQEAKK